MLKSKRIELHRLIEDILANSKDEEYKKYIRSLSLGVKKIAQKTIEIGDFAFDFLEENESTKVITEELRDAYIITFKWAEVLKAFHILWRDTLFEQEKAQVLFNVSKTDEYALLNLRRQSKEALEEGKNYLAVFLEEEIVTIENSPQGLKKYVEQFSAQKNPWKTYRKQIEKLALQCEELLDQNKTLLFVVEEYERIEDVIRKTIIDNQAELGEAELFLTEITNYVDEHAAESPKNIAKKLEEIERTTPMLKSVPSQVAALIKEETNRLPEETTVSVALHAGFIEVKEINFRRLTRQWLESEILPQLYEVWEIAESMRTGLKLSLVNIRNRALMMSKEIEEKQVSTISADALCRPLHDFSTVVTSYKEKCTDIYSLVDERLNSEFQIAEIYSDNDEFLEIPIQSTINQFVFGQNDIASNLKKRWGNFVQKAHDFKNDVKREDTLSISEKIVRYLENRKADPNNQQYSAIFLTKGYVGESFRVGRQEEIVRIDRLFNQWKEGYRGAVLITGERFTGKTLFGDLVSERHFVDNTIRVAPYSEIKIKGRSFTTECNLNNTLNFVKKNASQSMSMLWIDDLEYWSNDKNTLAENVRALQKFTDDYSGKFFIVASLSNWLKTHLSKMLHFNRYFQAEINLDFMSKEDISRAIAIRHGATHKNLINEKGEVFNSDAFNKMTSETYKYSRGNIGEALLHWTNSLISVNDDEVKQSTTSYPALPDFISSDVALLLTITLLNRRINEYEFRKLFGSTWNKKYHSILQRLMSVGLMKRRIDGRLEVEEMAVNDIGRLLQKHKYLD